MWYYVTYFFLPQKIEFLISWKDKKNTYTHVLAGHSMRTVYFLKAKEAWPNSCGNNKKFKNHHHILKPMMKETMENEEIEAESRESTAAISEESLHNNNNNNEDEDVKSMRHREKIDEKLKFYAEECKRYSIEKWKIIQQYIQESCDNCNLQSHLIGSLQCQVMFEAFDKIPSTPLATINLRNNHLEHFCCHSMASYIESSMTLRNLNLQGCQIGDKGMEILSAAFATSISIEHLNVANNQITDDGGEVFVKFLMGNNSCCDLNLSSNKLGVKTAKMLGKILQDNKNLKKLDMSHNQLYQQLAIVDIMKGFITNEVLEHLDVSWNGVCGEKVGNILSKSLRSSKLKVFKIENNRLTTYEIEKLARGMKKSETIEEIYVGGNLLTLNDDQTFINVFNSQSPLRLLSFGNNFHISHDAFEVKLLNSIDV